MNRLWSAVILAGIAFTAGCRADLHQAQKGFGIIREHIIAAPHNLPPIRSEFDFTILAIDNAPVVRETLPPLTDMPAGALVPVGTHSIRARVQPHLLPRGYQPYEVSFKAAVESGKVYYLVDKERLPILVEDHPAPR